MLFALLAHRQTLGVHWDLLLEMPGMRRLMTWRLAENPLVGSARIAAELIAPHRRYYLSYEGAIGRGRGFVRRVDRGELVWRQMTPGQWRFLLLGTSLHHAAAIDGSPRGVLRLSTAGLD